MMKKQFVLATVTMAIVAIGAYVLWVGNSPPEHAGIGDNFVSDGVATKTISTGALELSSPLGQDAGHRDPAPAIASSEEVAKARLAAPNTKTSTPEKPDPFPEVPDQIEVLEKERDRLKAELDLLSVPLLKDKLDKGLAEHVGDEYKYNISATENSTIYAIYVLPEGGVYKSVIGRAERPDLYMLKDEIVNLDLTIGQMERERVAAPK